MPPVFSPFYFSFNASPVQPNTGVCEVVADKRVQRSGVSDGKSKHSGVSWKGKLDPSPGLHGSAEVTILQGQENLILDSDLIH